MRTLKAADRFALLVSVPLVIGLVAAGPAAAAPDGKAVFLAQKCNLCHAVSSAGIEATVKSEAMRGPDLAGVMAEKGQEWATKFLKHQVELNGKQHKKEWKGSDDDLKALLAWLAEQKKPAK